MPKVFPVQRSFSAGEISPLSWNRDDLKGYQSGLKTLSNLVCDPRGPVETRYGTRYYRDIEGLVAKMFTFYVSPGLSFTVVVTDTDVLIFDLRGVEVYKHGSSIAKVAEVPGVTAEMPPGANEMYLLHPAFAPMKITYAEEVWSLITVSFVGAPLHWLEGNYPNTLTFFQGRSWWGGTPLNPETFNASQSGLFEDLTQGAEADDGLEFTLSKKGRIKWLEGVKNLLIGTDRGEYIVNSQEGVITPSDVEVEQQSAYGSSEVQSVPIGNLILYVSADGTKVRDMGYQFTEDGWLSRDVTFMSEHVTAAGIKEMHWDQDPSTVLWCLLQDGTIAGLTYEKGNDILGWHRHSVDHIDVQVETMTVVDEGGVTTPWAVLRDGGTLRLVGYDPERRIDLFIMGLDGSDKTFTAPHLANKTCRVIAGGALHPDVVLDAGGVGQLQWAADLVDVGLGFRQSLRTLPEVSAGQTGATLPFQKRWSKIYVRLLDCRRPLINDQRPPTRFPSTPMDTLDPKYVEDVSVANMGWDPYGEILVEQDLPLLLRVSGVYGEMAHKTL